MQTIVIGPEKLWIDDVLGYGQGPATPEHRVYLIEHLKGQDPRWAALRIACTKMHAWVGDPGPGHPLTGVTQREVPKRYREDPAEWEGLYANISSDTAVIQKA